MKKKIIPKKVISSEDKICENIVKNICKYCKYSEKTCICNDSWSWKNFDKDIQYTVDNEFKPTPLKVSTMTVCFNLTNCIINIEKLNNDFIKGKYFKERSFIKDAKKSKDKEKNNVMYNQCKLKGVIEENGQKSNLNLMIFKNGAFKLTGVKNPLSICKIIRDIDFTLKNGNFLEINSDSCIMTNVRICMINTNFVIGNKFGSCKENTLNQNVLNEILNLEEHKIENGGSIKSSTFDQDKYPGINVKHVFRDKMENFDKSKKMSLTRKGREKLPGEVTLLIFSSGAIIITGGKSLDEIISAYKFINDIIVYYKDNVVLN